MDKHEKGSIELTKITSVKKFHRISGPSVERFIAHFRIWDDDETFYAFEDAFNLSVDFELAEGCIADELSNEYRSDIDELEMKRRKEKADSFDEIWDIPDYTDVVPKYVIDNNVRELKRSYAWSLVENIDTVKFINDAEYRKSVYDDAQNRNKAFFEKYHSQKDGCFAWY